MSKKEALMPTTIVIFGGTGDLAKSKLFPALLDLYVAEELPDKFFILGLSRKDWTKEEYQEFVAESLKQKGHNHSIDTIKKFCSHINYTIGDFTKLETYEQIKDIVSESDETIGQCTNKLFYLAVPPQYYESIFENLAQSNAMKLCDEVGSWSRLLVEKPFGKDLKTAQSLEKKLCSLFNEEQIFRIDHYLAKDAIENIFAIRFLNTIFSDTWNGTAIESVSIRLFEDKDVSNRGAFYDEIGALRDVGQNHLLQIFALLTMSYADIYDPKAIRNARRDALQALAGSELIDLSRGQYEGYSEHQGVDKGSDTETYFKIDFSLGSDKWQDTKFTLEAGKAWNQKVNEAVVTFRPKKMSLKSDDDVSVDYKNVLYIQFAPEQKISLTLWSKKPGFEFLVHERKLNLADGAGEDCNSKEAYERVLFDCIKGDQTRFVSGEEVEQAWRFITPVLEQIKERPLKTYHPGTADSVD